MQAYKKCGLDTFLCQLGYFFLHILHVNNWFIFNQIYEGHFPVIFCSPYKPQQIMVSFDVHIFFEKILIIYWKFLYQNDYQIMSFKAVIFKSLITPSHPMNSMKYVPMGSIIDWHVCRIAREGTETSKLPLFFNMLRIPDSCDAKIVKISNLLTFWPVIQVIGPLFQQMVY